jgi:hypothetical protein
MIDIPEERILKEITDILMNDLPKVLLELEEQSEDSIRLPPFRYVGLEENLPPGTGLPYGFVEIEEGAYTEKDRIVKNRKYSVLITPRLMDHSEVWKYLHCLERVLPVRDASGSRMRALVKKTDHSLSLCIFQ